MFKIIKKLPVLLIMSMLFMLSIGDVYAREGQVLGVHILNPGEIDNADKMLDVSSSLDQDSESNENSDDNLWKYVTIPLSLNDLEKQGEWQTFFDQSKKKKIIPIVRLVTKFEDNAWKRPNRKEITSLVSFLSKLEWPTEEKYIIMFNEVNHAPEWGGSVDPESYADAFIFASNWAHSEDLNYIVLPAAMDLAAPNGGSTMEAFNYLSQLYEIDPEIFSYIDVWNSHSYPNPAFSSSPQRTGKNSLRGFEHELAFLKEKTDEDFQVMITETGWVTNRSTSSWLESYYTYALQHIWSHPQIIAVTPFVMQGAPGPFAGFSFLDDTGKPTAQYHALQAALKKTAGDKPGS